MAEDAENINLLREYGNNLYTKGEYENALDKYLNGLEYAKDSSNDLRTKLYNNIAACYLKLEKYDEVLKFTNLTLEHAPNDQKSLYRRCLSYQKSGRTKDAFYDIKRLLDINPKKELYIELGQSLYVQLNEENLKLTKPTNVFRTLINQMDASDSVEGMQKCTNTILSFLSDSNNRNQICSEENIKHVLSMFDSPNHHLICIKILSLLCANNYKNTMFLLKHVDQNVIKSCLSSSNAELFLATFIYMGNVIENIITYVSTINTPPKDDDTYLAKKNYRDSYLACLRSNDIFNNYIDLIVQSIKRKTEVKLAIQLLNIFNKILTIDEYIGLYFLEVRWLQSLIELAVNTIDICDVTQCLTDSHYMLFNNISSFLHLIHQSTKCIPEYLKTFYAQIESHLFTKFDKNEFITIHFLLSLYPVLSVSIDISEYFLLESKLKCGDKFITFLDFIIKSNFEIDIQKPKYNYSIILFIGETMLSAQSCRKFKSLTSFNELSRKIFLYFYNCADLSSKLIGLLGLVKCVSDNPDPDNSLFLNYLKIIKPLVLTKQAQKDECKLLEILSFLSLNAEVKEDIIKDTNFLKSLMDLTLHYCTEIKKITQDSKHTDHLLFLPFLFFTCTVFANICNIAPPDKLGSSEEEVYGHNRKELKKLAQSIGQPLPKRHPKDKKQYVKERINVLSTPKFFTILFDITISLKYSNTSKTGSIMLSKHCPYYISSLYYTMLINPDVRGIASQAGAIKALLILARSLKIQQYLPSNSLAYLETPYIAAHALALIGITIDPNLTFHGESLNETLRPLLCIADFDQKPLRRFEALLALTNFASVNDLLREHFVSIEGGFQIIKTGLFDNNKMIQRAATEFITNMMQCEKFVVLYYTPPPIEERKDLSNDTQDSRAENIRLLVLLSGELEDEKLSSAASGGLALLSYYEIPSQYIVEVKSFFEIIQELLVCNNINLVYRAMFIINNIMKHNKTLAERIINSNVLEIMLALEIKMKNDNNEIDTKIKQLIKNSLNISNSYGLVEKV